MIDLAQCGQHYKNIQSQWGWSYDGVTCRIKEPYTLEGVTSAQSRPVPSHPLQQHLGVHSMSKTWVVVAESSRAKIFELSKKNAPLKELQGFANTASRSHEHNLTSDLPGRVNNSTHGSHKLSSHTSPKEHETVEFARTLGSHLDEALNRGEFDKLVIMSPPGFLGHLRKEMSYETSKHVVSEIDKNLVRHSTSDIQSHLPYSF